MDLDELFGDGAELGDDVVVKAQLRFRVHPPKHPVAADLVDRLTTAYDERLDMICEEIGDVLKHADLRRSTRSQALVLDLRRGKTESIEKAVKPVYAPGAKGGKWYRDGAGHVRYGEKPTGRFRQRANGEHMMPHIGHYRPSPFAGMRGIDRDLTGFLMHSGPRYGFSPPELHFLGAWYGTSTKSGALFDAFLDCAGLTRDDLKGDITQLRFGGQKLTYEEAVFEFFAAQRPLFMGDEANVEDADETWNTMLNDQIKPLLDSVFSKYEALKDSDEFKEQYAAEPDRIRRRFFENARATQKETLDVATHITSGWDPEKQVTEVIAGMKTLGLFDSKADQRAIIGGRPHLKGSIVLDDRLLTDEPGNPLVEKKEKLATLTASQLMILYVAAELHRRWDPDSRSYSDEKQADIGPGALGETIYNALAELPDWGGAAALVHKHLDAVVDRVVGALNTMNTGAE